MNKITTTVTLGALSCALVAGLGAVPAFADAPAASSTPTPTPTPIHQPRTLAEIQASAATQTAGRVTKLNAAIAKVNADSSLSSSHKTAILGTLNGDLAGMKTVAGKVAADTTVSQASADFHSLFSSYRVYAVALPQAQIAAAADQATVVEIPRLTAEKTRLSGLLAGKDKSKSTPALQSDLTDAATQIQKAGSTLGNVAGSALAVTPAAYNSNHDAVKSIRTSLTTARAALKLARTDLKNVASALTAK